MPRRPIYSEAHDRSLYPSKTGKGRKRKAGTPPVLTSTGIPPDISVGFLPKNLSEEQRISIRARQLLAEKNVRSLPIEQIKSGEPINRHPLPDHDIQYDDDLDVRDPRGEQGNQFDGRTIFPEVLGPAPDRMLMRTLSEDDLHPGLPDFEHPSQVNASKELIAAVPADDKMILAFDNILSTLHANLRTARHTAEQMAQSVRRQDDNPSAPDSPTSHAENVVQMIARIIEPWYMALDSEFSDILKGTIQGEAVQEGEI